MEESASKLILEYNSGREPERLKIKLDVVSWVAALTGAPAEVIAIDGKTLRRSYQKKGMEAV